MNNLFGEIEIEPGVYDDVPFEVYCRWSAVNNSRLKWLNKSAAHFASNASIEPTKALRLGRLIHSGKLEPETVPELYAVMPAFELDPNNRTQNGKPSTSKTTTFYKDLAAAFIDENPGKEIVPQEYYDLMLGVVKSLDKHPRAVEYLLGKTEVSICWIDPDTGLKCKARIDVLQSPGITDLKSVADASDFAKSMADYDYHRQFAFYQDGWSIASGSGELVPVRVVAVEKAEPYASCSAPIAERALIEGRENYKSKLSIVRCCIDNDSWPGYEQPDAFDLPEWFYRNQSRPVDIVVGGQTLEV